MKIFRVPKEKCVFQSLPQHQSVYSRRKAQHIDLLPTWHTSIMEFQKENLFIGEEERRGMTLFPSLVKPSFFTFEDVDLGLSRYLKGGREESLSSKLLGAFTFQIVRFPLFYLDCFLAIGHPG